MRQRGIGSYPEEKPLLEQRWPPKEPQPVDLEDTLEVVGTLYSPYTDQLEVDSRRRINQFLSRYPGLGYAWDLSMPKYIPLASSPQGEYVLRGRHRRYVSSIRSLFSMSYRRVIVSSWRKHPVRLRLGSNDELLFLVDWHFVSGTVLLGSDHAVRLRGKRGPNGRWTPTYGTRVVALDVDLPAGGYRGFVEDFLLGIREKEGLMGFYGLSYSGRMHVYFLFKKTLPLRRAFALGRKLCEKFLSLLPTQKRSAVSFYPSNDKAPGKTLFLPIGFVSNGLASVDIGFPTPLSSLVSFFEENLNDFPDLPTGKGSNAVRGLARSYSIEVGFSPSPFPTRPLGAVGKPGEGSVEEKTFPVGLGVEREDHAGGISDEEGALPQLAEDSAPGRPYVLLDHELALEAFRSAVRRVAPYYAPGNRQDTVMGLAGFGARLGVDKAAALQEIEPLLEGDEERAKREKAFTITYQKAEEGRTVAWRPWLEDLLITRLPEDVASFMEANSDLCNRFADRLRVSPRILRLAIIILAEVVSKSLLGKALLGYNALAKRWRASKRDVSAAFKILLSKGLIHRAEKGFYTLFPDGGKKGVPSSYQLLNDELLQVDNAEKFFLTVVHLLG